ncbi:hypothetical protein NEIFLAOT_01283 [Neisseria flavescens NRL30031/H210]|uniref:Uncharacterized protein n=1 Tax=Neisseria flavescens NRL30031/H210 TaxID=546264 RepID=C0EMV7_NEIFL|nr:hypothetical protein NEIFLAOT_01283 [Neisseria flavescens NRL30031/H210]
MWPGNHWIAMSFSSFYSYLRPSEKSLFFRRPRYLDNRSIRI